ncbi:MAG: type II toxin-antitoxin system HicA family toxin [Blastocatellia bacterium]
MNKCRKLLNAARRSQKNLRFSDLCKLAECYGWTFKRQDGSHKIYENGRLTPEQGRIMNFQDHQGKAKPYQVTQLLNAIDNLGDE